MFEIVPLAWGAHSPHTYLLVKDHGILINILNFWEIVSLAWLHGGDLAKLLLNFEKAYDLSGVGFS